LVVTSWPRSEEFQRHALIDDVVFSEQNPGAADWRGGRGGRRCHGFHDRRDRRPVQHSADRAEQLRGLDWLGQVGRDPQVAAPLGVAVAPGRCQHHDRRAGQVRPRSDLFGDGEPVLTGHVGIEQHTSWNGLPSRAAASSASSAAAPHSTEVGIMCHRVTCSCRMRRFTALSSTIRTVTSASDSG
jgi:hypothetical protein